MIFLSLLCTALAGGHYHVGVGVRGMARAGAFVASADDLSAQTYNVAALSRLQDSQCYMARLWIRQRTVFTPQGYELPRGRTLTSGDRVTPIPSFGCALRTGEGDDLGRLTVAFGLSSPIAPSVLFDPEELDEERTSLYDSLQSHVLVGPYAAYQLTDWLALGVGLFWAPLRIRQSSKALICDFDECGVSAVHMDGLVILGQAMSAGLLLRPGGMSSRWSLGLSGHYTRPMTGDVDVLIESYGVARGDLVQSLPLILRAGVSYQAERWALEVTAVNERWSGTQTGFEFRVLEDDPLEAPDVSYVFYDQLEDVWSGRIGGDYRWTEGVTVTGGVAVESGAVPEESWSLDLMGGPRLILGAGLSVQARPPVRVDLAFAQRFLLHQHITESRVAQQVVRIGSAEPEVTPSAMGNGEYRVRFPSLGVGVSFAY